VGQPWGCVPLFAQICAALPSFRRRSAIDVDGCSIHSMRPGTETETERRVRVEQLEDAERAAPQWESSPHCGLLYVPGANSLGALEQCLTHALHPARRLVVSRSTRLLQCRVEGSRWRFRRSERTPRLALSALSDGTVRSISLALPARRKLTLPVPAKPRITREGLAGVRPSRQARTWSHDGAQDGRDGVRRRRRRGRDDHRFASYYGKPIIRWRAVRAPAPGAALQAVRLGRARRVDDRANARPRSSGALSEHAARVQADLADERRLVAARRVRAVERRGGRRRRARRCAARGARGVGLFEAGMASARDPRYTVEPQRERLSARGEPDAPTEGG
jgi:hypothetical protein